VVGVAAGRVIGVAAGRLIGVAAGTVIRAIDTIVSYFDAVVNGQEVLFLWPYC
jgi:hypothetical protein